MSHVPFDPRDLPNAGRTLDLALDQCAALALLDGDRRTAWPRCRVAALRYAEAVRAGGHRPRVALALRRRPVYTWLPRGVALEVRHDLARRLAFWVGTVYGLRWRTADGDNVPCSSATAPGRLD